MTIVGPFQEKRRLKSRVDHWKPNTRQLENIAHILGIKSVLRLVKLPSQISVLASRF